MSLRVPSPPPPPPPSPLDLPPVSPHARPLPAKPPRSPATPSTPRAPCPSSLSGRVERLSALDDIYGLAMFRDEKLFAAVAQQARAEKDRAEKKLADICTQILAISYLIQTDGLAAAARKCLNQATLNRLDISADQLGEHLCQLRERASRA